MFWKQRESPLEVRNRESRLATAQRCEASAIVRVHRKLYGVEVAVP